jgi:hypothetical protein
MKWLDSVFGRREIAGESYTTRRVTSKHPLIIQDPKIGFLNLMGPSAHPLIEEDKSALKPLFSRFVESDGAVPVCDVLMIYAKVNSNGAIQNASSSLRVIIHESHAPIVVVAAANDAQSYMAAGKLPGVGRANLVMTLNRNGRTFPNFFKELFAMMYRGVTMPMAWVKLAPQIPGKEQPNVPGTICAMEVTHVLFKTGADSAAAPQD